MVYDYNSNRLFLRLKKGLTYDLSLRWGVTIVRGDSATGKTLLYNSIAEMKRHSVAKDRVSNIILVNDIFDFSSDFEGLTIIDKGDIFLSSDMCSKISSSKNMRYLVFTRSNLPIGYSPNHFGEFVLNDNIISIYYMFNHKGWN